MNLRKDHYRIAAASSVKRRPVTTRVARRSAPVDEHSVSRRPRLTVSGPERARRRSTVDVTNGFGGHALPVSASRVPFPSNDRSASPARGRPRLLRRGGRPPAADGESTGRRRASAGTARVRGRRTPCPVRGSKSRSSSSRPPTIGLARVLCFGSATGGRPGVVFLFLFVTA